MATTRRVIRDVPDAEPARVDAPDGYRDAVSRLAAAQKLGHGEPAYLRWVNRPLGRRAAAGAFVLGLSPNAVTALSLVFSVAGMIILASTGPTLVLAPISTLLLLAGYALDSADGQLARLTKTGSVAGEWLDHVVDAFRLPAFHVAVAVYFFGAVGPEYRWIVLVALAFGVISSVWFFAATLAGKLVPTRPAGGDVPTQPAWMSFLRAPNDISTLYLAVLLAPIPSAFAIVYLGLFALNVLTGSLSLLRKYRLLAGPREPKHDRA